MKGSPIPPLSMANEINLLVHFITVPTFLGREKRTERGTTRWLMGPERRGLHKRVAELGS